MIQCPTANPRPICLLCLALLLVVAAFPAYAYLDPASDSILVQLLLGGGAGVALVLKLYWGKILSLLGMKREKQDDSLV